LITIASGAFAISAIGARSLTGSRSTFMTGLKPAMLLGISSSV
jgi:hypothetical protein